MIEKEYFDKIDALRKEIYEECPPDIIHKLDALFEIKPVRLKWFIAKAEAMVKLKYPIAQVYALLSKSIYGADAYNGTGEFWDFYANLSKHNPLNYNRILHVKKSRETQRSTQEDVFLNELYTQLYEHKCNYLENTQSEVHLNKLIEAYFTTENVLMYYVLSLFYKNKYNQQLKIPAYVEAFTNMGYIKSIMEDDHAETFIIAVTDEYDKEDCYLLGNALISFGKNVYILDIANEFPVEDEIDLENTLSISIENAFDYNGMTVIYPIRIFFDGNNMGDNSAYIIDYLCKEYAMNQLATIFCSGNLMDELCQRPLLQKQMERLLPFQAECLEDKMTFGWVGKYTSYISHIYDFDVEKEMKEPSQCQFSIVIPARNSAGALQHTLKTCLNQRYKGAYEIVLSDNSTQGNLEVYNLYCELKDDRIKYYKTPRDLSLSRSFEFAYLKAKGEFIISIGSDDAVLPWTLEILDEIIQKYPDEDIIQWERGFYAWPDFNGGQRNQFFIPSKYEKRLYQVDKIDKNDYLAKILNKPKSMYGLPLLYINSGFRRRYLNKLLMHTGRLWDGICQDIYMGVINIGINDAILNVKYPLTIAGMTGNSVGAKSNEGITTIKESNSIIEENKLTSNIGGFSTSIIERLMPEVTTDISSLYNSLLRAVARGVLPVEFLGSLFDWKKMFTECFAQLEITDVLFDKKLHYFRYVAAKHGEAFLKWFDETIYEKAIDPIPIDEKRMVDIRNEKTYQEGTLESGGVILDASNYGVTNVFEAAQLFEKLTGL